MKIRYSTKLAFKLWLLTAIIVSTVLNTILIFRSEESFSFGWSMLILIGCILCSIPALVLLILFLPFAEYADKEYKQFYFFLLIMFLIATGYGSMAVFLDLEIFGNMIFSDHNLNSFFTGTLIIYLCSLLAFVIAEHKKIFSTSKKTSPQILSPIQSKIMYEENLPEKTQTVSTSNKLLIKGLITAGLILAMLIPTIFIKNLVQEREQRQKEVVKEVSSKWANSQTLSGPYLAIPYNDGSRVEGNVLIKNRIYLTIPAEKMEVIATINPEERKRSIYKVALYRADVNFSGNFRPSWPTDMKLENLELDKAQLCFNLDDYKGIEEQTEILFNNKQYQLNPGLPSTDIGLNGLSVPVSMTMESLNSGISFRFNLKIKGSEQLHFLPLAYSSKFTVSSTWPDPSFDGNTLPNSRNVKDSGFKAEWSFNRANLPFANVIRPGKINTENLSFGVSMVQPAGQYDKTMRSVKYALLVIGLSFGLFFIIESTQKKPFHPMQYILVGIAMIIFYTLLLSISEYLLFDLSYLIASVAIVGLISLYAHAHFHSIKITLVFTFLLSLLYGFIFILIRLEDTALLVGSIGLFFILALIMYASRKINWYGAQTIVAAQ